MGRVCVMANTRSNAKHFVRGDRSPNSATADQHSAIRLSINDSLSDRFCIIGIIDRVSSISSNVNNLMAELAYRMCQNFFQKDTGVIGSDYDSHVSSSVKWLNNKWLFAFGESTTVNSRS